MPQKARLAAPGIKCVLPTKAIGRYLQARTLGAGASTQPFTDRVGDHRGALLAGGKTQRGRSPGLQGESVSPDTAAEVVTSPRSGGVRRSATAEHQVEGKTESGK